MNRNFAAQLNYFTIILRLFYDYNTVNRKEVIDTLVKQMKIPIFQLIVIFLQKQQRKCNSQMH
jgi:hypothetical protein